MIKPPSQAPFAPVPQAWFSFSLFAFIFQLFSCPSALPPPHFSFFIHHCAFPPSPLFIPHNSSFIIYLSAFNLHQGI
jgi:hypothetical protein